MDEGQPRTLSVVFHNEGSTSVLHNDWSASILACSKLSESATRETTKLSWVWFLRKWRRGQDSNLHILSDGGFQDRCTTNYATPPNWLVNHNVRRLYPQLVAPHP